MIIEESTVIQQTFSSKIMSWYAQNKRDLPWRHTKNPYHIWLSEVILQQTRVNQGLPYYHSFIELFPTVHHLAKAEERDVLRAWQGLGYYSRARNLHKCAKIISENMEGIFPNTHIDLLKLPGVGRYTAAAIASIVNGERVAVVDGNVFRVLSRVFGIYDDIGSSAGQKIFYKKANELVPAKNPDIFNQSIMEFGAIQCTPKNPDCQNCPLAIECYARINHEQTELPVKLKKVKVRHRFFHYICVRHEGSLLLKERKGRGIWQGLYDFYLIERDELLELTDLIDDPFLKQLNSQTKHIEESEEYKHVLTHQQISAKFFTVHLKQIPDENDYNLHGLQLFNAQELTEIPKPVLISSYLKDNFL
jgi:A/G-specific adenine glycosylase